MHDITNNKHSLTFACPSSRRGPCCGSYHPVSLQTTALLTVILILILILMLCW